MNDNQYLSSSENAGAGHIVVVEDDADAREVLAELLECHGFAVAACADGSQALAALRKAPGAFLLTDVGLRDEDGIALATDAVLRYPDCRVIIMSGHTRSSLDFPEDWQWLQKPLDLGNLLLTFQRSRDEP